MANSKKQAILDEMSKRMGRAGLTVRVRFLTSTTIGNRFHVFDSVADIPARSAVHLAELGYVEPLSSLPTGPEFEAVRAEVRESRAARRGYAPEKMNRRVEIR